MYEKLTSERVVSLMRSLDLEILRQCMRLYEAISARTKYHLYESQECTLRRSRHLIFKVNLLLDVGFLHLNL